jgi:FkbM family methyltransferase
MFNHIRHRLIFLEWCVKTFSSLADVSAALRLSQNKIVQSDSKIAVHPRALGGKTIYCRPGTTDWETFCSAFNDQYHLPPKHCNQLSCIVDLGANVGYTAAHFACLYPHSRVIAVEMDLNNYEVATENVRHWPSRVKLFHAAIWSSNGNMTYYSDVPQDAYRIKVVPTEPHISTRADRQVKVVPAVTMDRLIDQFCIKRIDYLKVDIEGAENELFFSSSLNWLNIVTALKIEIHRPEDMDKYQNVLTAAGFTTYKDNHHWCTVVGFRVPVSM